MDSTLFWTVVSAIVAVLALSYMVLQDILRVDTRIKLISRVLRLICWVLGGIIIGVVLLETKNINTSVRTGLVWGTIVGGIYGVVAVTVINPVTLIAYHPTFSDILMVTSTYAVAGLVGGTLTGATIWTIENIYFNPTVDSLVYIINETSLRIIVAGIIWAACLFVVWMIVKAIDRVADT